MFGSRKQRQPVPPLTVATANPNAATAAATVFKRHESNSSLSAAAAAAALAARPITPTRVADVQTKRTLRRSASIASSAASSDALGRPALQRRGSSGSMTERSFRSPSPHRPASSGSGHRQSHSLTYATSGDMPPVPALPRDVGRNVAISGVGAQQEPPHRRATSIGISNTPVRLASQSLGSADAPSWFGASKLGDPQNVRRTDPAMASPPSSPPEATRELHHEGARPSSRASSINFSYPTRVKVGSPPVSPVDTRHSTEFPLRVEPQAQALGDRSAQQPRQPKTNGKKRRSVSESSYVTSGLVSGLSEQVLVYDPNSRRMVPKVVPRSAEPVTSGSSGQQLKPRRKKQTSQRAGSHLAKGTMGHSKISTSINPQEQGKPTAGTALQLRIQTQEQSLPPEGAANFDEPAVKPILSSPRTEAQRKEQHGLSDDATQLRVKSPQPGTTAAPAPALIPWESSRQSLKRQPSVVKEELEPESEPERPAQMTISDALDSVPARQGVRIESRSETFPDSQSLQKATPSSPPDGGELNLTVEGVRSVPYDSAREPSPLDTLATNQPSGSATERASSNSPVRQAHFGTVSNKLTVRHSPPPRSVSPRKSALKHSSPSRGVSPSDDTSEASGGINPPGEPPITRKKSVRVSFDDGNTMVVGESVPVDQFDSPQAASPQTAVSRRPWYSSIGRNTKELPLLDDDEVMKPRPALPSFGSIRGRKARESVPEEEERPLVRPLADRSYHSTTSKHATTTGNSSPGSSAPSQSNDHAIAAILAKEYEDRSRNPANISRFREPLPPVVLSVEGTGYMSDSSSSSSPYESEVPAPPEEAPDPTGSNKTAILETQTIPPEELPAGPNTSEVAVPPEAMLDKEKPPEVAVPSISVSLPTPPIVEKKSNASFFLDVPGSFPQDDSDLSAPDTSPSTATIGKVAEESSRRMANGYHDTLSAAADSASGSETSIYSDAYEDLSEIEGDGFQSLDAVLGKPADSRTGPEPPSQEITPETPSDLLEAVKARVQMPIAAVLTTQAVVPGDEWERAKAYWRSLTAEKRAQLEREAMEDAGVEGDLEELKSEPKPKKKKSVERRNSERKALAVHLAQQSVIAQEKKNLTAPVERSYMVQPGTKWSKNDGEGPSLRAPLPSQAQQQPVLPGSSSGSRLRKSMRTTTPAIIGAEPIEPSWTKLPGKQPLSLPLAHTAAPDPAAHRRRTSEHMSQGDAEPQKPGFHLVTVRRRGSTSSESSFKRSRPSSGVQASGFRMSMRPTPPPSSQPERHGSKRFSLRSLSPAGSSLKRTPDAPPVSLATGTQMRQTLRDSSNERKKNPSGIRMPSFGLSPSSKRAGKRASSSKLPSRFADSSDEDDNRKKLSFRSRFEDSSDEEVISPLALPKSPTPAIGHLRNQDSIASTALPEELEESEELLVTGTPGTQPVRQAKVNIGTPPVARSNSAHIRPSRSGSGRLPASQTAPTIGGTPTSKGAERHTSKRNSLMTALRRRKPDAVGKISRPAVTESAARQDTRLERNLSQLRDIRRASGEAAPEAENDLEGDGEAETELPRSPRLQKRIVSLAHSIENTKADGATTENATGDVKLPSPAVDLPSSAPVAAGVVDDKEFIRTPLRRPSAASGNLGTRTLGGGPGAQPGFLQRRTLSSGVMSLDTPSVAGTGQKKKKFGVLRRMFGLND